MVLSRNPLLQATFRALRILLVVVVVCGVPAASQQTSAISSSSMVAIPSQSANAAISSSTPEEQPEREANPAFGVEPVWVTTTDSDHNLRRRVKLGGDFGIGDHTRLGLMFADGFISSGLASAGPTSEEIRDLGITGQWHPSNALKLNALVGVSEAESAIGSEGQSIGQAFIPMADLKLHFTPSGKILKVDLGFERSIYDLSPELVANRVVRNEFVLHPQLALPDGWRLRALAELGPMTEPGQSNARYNSEFTVGHKLGKASELYSTYSRLHFAKGSDAGYFSPDLVQNFEGGWSSDIDRKAFSLSLDFGAGAGHAREHGEETFGPWGLSAHTGTFLNWSFSEGRELNASYEFYYDKSSPAVLPATSGAWHMSVVTVSFRWSTAH